MSSAVWQSTQTLNQTCLRESWSTTNLPRLRKQGYSAIGWPVASFHVSFS
jgi:hypothetical protein